MQITALLRLMIEVIEVRLGSSPSVIEGDSHERRDRVTIAQRLHSRVPYYDGMKHRLIPVRVLVPHRREDLVQMVDVGVTDEGAQNAIPVILLEAELYVVGVEIEIGLGRGDAQDQRHLDERVARALHVQTRIGIALVHRQTRPDAGHESGNGADLLPLASRRACVFARINQYNKGIKSIKAELLTRRDPDGNPIIIQHAPLIIPQLVVSQVHFADLTVNSRMSWRM